MVGSMSCEREQQFILSLSTFHFVAPIKAIDLPEGNVAHKYPPPSLSFSS